MELVDSTRGTLAPRYDTHGPDLDVEGRYQCLDRVTRDVTV